MGAVHTPDAKGAREDTMILGLLVSGGVGAAAAVAVRARNGSLRERNRLAGSAVELDEYDGALDD